MGVLCRELRLRFVNFLYRFVEEYRVLRLQECWILVLALARVSGEEIDVSLLALLLLFCS